MKKLYIERFYLNRGQRRIPYDCTYHPEMRTETDSAYMIVVEVSAAAGVFSISFMQRFTTDVYLDTFLDELHQQGLTYEITDRHPLQIAPIADYRGDWIKEPEATDEEAKNEYTLIDR